MIFHKKITIAAVGIVILVFLAIFWNPFSASKYEKRGVLLHKQKSFHNRPHTRDAVPLAQDKRTASDTVKIQLPGSIKEYVRRFQEVLNLTDDQNRWNALRAMGISLSDDSFSQIKSHLADGTFEKAMFSLWVKLDPLAAGNWAYRLQSFPKSAMSEFWDQKDLLSSITEQWSSQDPQSALAWAQNLPSGLGHDYALKGIMTNLCVSNWDMTISLFQEIEDKTISGSIVSTIIQRLATIDPVQAALKIELLPEELKRFAIWQVERMWVQKDPLATLHWLESLPEGNDKTLRNPKYEALQRFVGDWAKIDLESARKWAESIADNAQFQAIDPISKVAGVWAEKDPLSALRWVQQLSNTKAQYAIATAWVKHDPQAAVSYAESLLEGKERDRLFGLLITDQALYEGSKISFADALALIETLPEENRKLSLHFLVQVWENKDPNAVFKWMKKQPAGTFKDDIISTFILKQDGDESLKLNDAMYLANQISDDSRRDEAIQQVAKTWLFKDQSAATQWILHSSLSQEIKDKLLGQK